MKRRAFIALVGGAAVWPPLATGAQQPTVPVIGVLGTASRQSETIRMNAFREGIAQLGYDEGRNLAIEYRGAEGQYDRLPGLATELVRREVSVIATFGNIQTALAAKSATAGIPIVFMTGAEPLKHGLVASFNRPGSNITGVT